VYLAYVDDAGSTDHNLADKDAPFQVMCAALIRDSEFDYLEMFLSIHAVLSGMGEDFEFHARDLWHGTKQFENLPREKRLEAFGSAVNEIHNFKLPVIYGAVDKIKLSKQLYRSANPADIAFRMCSEDIEKWFAENAPTEMGLLIADKADEGKNRNLTRVFREYRKRFYQHKDSSQPHLEHLHDDMYFGDSRFSIGLQVADICSFLIARHLCEKNDTEHLFKMIESQIFSGRVVPE
jgi:hypothetical protein